MPRRFFLPLLLAAAATLSACQDAPTSTAPLPTPAAAKAGPAAAAAAAQDGPQDYIVVLKPHVTDVPGAVRRLAAAERAAPKTQWEHVLKGFAAHLPRAAAERLAADPDVLAVGPSQTLHADAVQTNPRWGLDRIDERPLPLDGQYVFDRTGAGRFAYIIDSGIRAGHVEFGGRVATGRTFVNDGLGTGDCTGHGTHVGSIIGGNTIGVAKQVTLIPVRVLDCNNSVSTWGLIDGMNWVAANGIRGRSVVNISIGAPADIFVDWAVQALFDAGFPVVVSAGNASTDACTRSPARSQHAIAVAATTSTDARASFSNFGSCVELFAPGQSILGASSTSNTAFVSLDGTSMAAPHVAGAAVLLLDMNPGLPPGSVRDMLTTMATAGVVTGTLGSPNRLLFTGFIK